MIDCSLSERKWSCQCADYIDIYLSWKEVLLQVRRILALPHGVSDSDKILAQLIVLPLEYDLANKAVNIEYCTLTGCAIVRSRAYLVDNTLNK